MKSSFWLFFIIGSLTLALIIIGVLTYISNTKPTTIFTPEVLAIMEKSEGKVNQAKNLLSKETTSTEQQNQAKKLIQESINDAKKATEMQPNNPQTWLFLSKIYTLLADVNPEVLVPAEEAVKKALALMPNNPKIYQELATVYIMAERYKDAEDILQKAIELDPKDPNGYFKLGNVYKSTEEKEKARKNYLKAKELTPATHATNSAMIDAQLKSLEK